jgi:glycerol-3-phosphate cytidylyltransferase
MLQIETPKIVYTGGSFDILHAGHYQFLEKCSHYGEVTVALNTDSFIKQFKGKSPVMPFHERYTILSACKYVKRVIANISGADSKPSILSVKPDYIIIGDDWKQKGKDYYKQMQFTKEWLKENKIELIYVPYTKGVSTTDLKQRILNY